MGSNYNGDILRDVRGGRHRFCDTILFRGVNGMKHKIINLEAATDLELDQYDGILAVAGEKLVFYGFSRDSLKTPYSPSVNGDGIKVKIDKCRVGNRLQISVTDSKGKIIGITSEKIIETILAWPKSAGKEE